MKAGRITGNAKAQKYVAAVDGEAFRVGIDESEVTVNEKVRDVQLTSIGDGGLFSLLLGSRSHEVFVERSKDGYHVTVDGERHHVSVSDELPAHSSEPQMGTRRGVQIAPVGSFGGRVEPARPAPGAGAITSPMTGVLIEFLVKEGQSVKSGDGLAILEAMKTENIIRCLFDGVVRSFEAIAGQTVRMDDVVLYMDVKEGRDKNENPVE